ncbi:ArsR family transcriptional regulator [Streptomyces cinnamoneus]|uniref:ArsR family transcriptional regulator n=1 Tax=Streptomyces cinnamoneus TaxID=53446 RepID=A0A2G1XA29_STRCJ|nr:Lrp/AsnC family transcriptional regulator [Streptomyces cinnamoneus]PHQ48080.1 ArsR family transcriptional regulator [Streptomyces cinnamoneus]PPT15706.1 Lrp/AsnC family transcriptional regulator [Streptomyces cinnamoneus]
MDSIDRMILRELQSEGRLPNAELADRVGLTPSPCLRRVRQLEADGVIRRYAAVVDPARIGRSFEVFVCVELQKEDRATITAFEDRVRELRDVVEAYRLFGGQDYLLRIAVADISAYEHCYTNELATLPGVARLTSHLAMKAVVAERPRPVDG